MQASQNVRVRSSSVAALVLVLGLGLGALGCNPTYAPPPRTAHNVAPDRLEPGEGEVAVSSSWYLRGSAVLSAEVAERVTLEGGLETGPGSWQLATGGARVTVVDAHGRTGPTMDLETGLAVGLGGERCQADYGDTLDCQGRVPDQRDWTERLAYGGYLGLGLGYRVVEELQLYTRGRVEVSVASGIPRTLWGSWVAGLELDLDPVMLHLVGGFGGFDNEVDGALGPLVELGVGIRFDLAGAR